MMKRHLAGWLSLLVMVTLALPISSSAHQNTQGTGTAKGFGPKVAGRGDGALRTWTGPLAKTQGTVKAVIELQDTPSVLAYAEGRKRGLATAQAGLASQSQLARIDRSQRQLLAPLSGMNAKVLYRVQRVYNGIAVTVDASKLAQIANLPGVKAIHPLVTKKLHHTASVPLIGAPQVWEQSIGDAKAIGTGISIAVIDSGLDYVHKGFGGTGDYTGVTDKSEPVWTTKVVGGYDFVGDEYDAREDEPIVAPDNNPMDCLSSNFTPDGTVGHGTHVAGTAAGLGVLSNGETYTGPYDSTTHSNNTFRIAPGVAPGATLYGLRVFGCYGSTDFADPAIEWAVDPNGDGNPSDHVDVINMSLGSDYGYAYDSTSVAAENAVAAGVAVVASAGNSYDTQYITGSPGSADSVISVASTTQPHTTVDAIRVLSGTAELTGTLQPATFSVSYPWRTSAPVSAPLIYLADKPGCSTFEAADVALITGKVVLIDWADGQCGSVARTNNYKAAGAVGLIIANNTDIFDLVLTGNATLPTVSIPKETGALLKSALPGLVIEFSGQLQSIGLLIDPDAVDTISEFSSRGPRRYGALKPDIAAPGSSIFSVLKASGDQGQTLGGTSMAAPHVAGVVAIMRQLHPDWTPAELKALVMNTATKSVRTAGPLDSETYGPTRVGGGRVNVPHAAETSVIAFDSAKPANVSVSFGNVEAVSSTTLTRTVTIQNKGTSAIIYDVGYTPSTTLPGASYTVSPAQVFVAAGGTATAVVVLSVPDVSKLQHVQDPTQDPAQTELPRVWLSDASGYLTLTPEATTRYFTANVRGYYENPQVDTEFYATGTFTYTAASDTLDYSIKFNEAITLSGAGGHIHRGAAGSNGPVTIPFPGTSSATLTGTSGSVTLTDADHALLLTGGLYVNFHTAANPGGEIRGQIVAANPALRVPVYASVRPASQMSGSTPSLLTLPPTADGSISLSGTGVNTGAKVPTDTVSLVSALELQHISPALVSTSAYTSYSDLKYVGVSSDYGTSEATSTVENTTLFFGVATQGNWASFNEIYFEVQIYTDTDDVIDYALFTTNTGTDDANDVVIATLAVFDNTGTPVDYIDQYYVNVVSPDTADTQPYNTNVVVLAVDAVDLGLTDAKSRFRYSILSDSNGVDNAVFDYTPELRYDVSRPGFKFNNGFLGLSAYQDLPGATIPFTFNQGNFRANGSEGILLLHHHNTTGTRAQIFQLHNRFLTGIRR
ncbi:MAG TPA: S8 family serine peptidase [Roseiflexaceae bacterium]|nr:S8 family serine peptidase [Roseiflexaceae bacterium]